MLLSQAANIGHALVVVEPRVASLPAFIPVGVVYFFAAAFAALFPLGGPMFVHVSGFIRVHAVDADWVSESARTPCVCPPRARDAAARAPRNGHARAGKEGTHVPEPAQGTHTVPEQGPGADHRADVSRRGPA